MTTPDEEPSKTFVAPEGLAWQRPVVRRHLPPGASLVGPVSHVHADGETCNEWCPPAPSPLEPGEA